MDCHETQQFFHAYLDRELDLVRNLELEAHVQKCPNCSQAYDSQLALRRQLQNSPVYFRAPARLRGRVRSALGRAGRPLERTIPWLSVPSWAAAVASVVLVAFTGWVFFARVSRGPASERLADEVVSAHVRSLMATHLTDISSSDQHTVKPWFTGKLDFSPPVVDLAQQEFLLVGGRLDYLASQPVAALIYQRRKHLLNVFVWPSPGDAAAVRPMTLNGYNVLHWNQGGMNYWVASDLNWGELNQFAQLVKMHAPGGSAPR